MSKFLKPLLDLRKHAQHNQKSHGNWSRGGRDWLSGGDDYLESKRILDDKSTKYIHEVREMKWKRSRDEEGTYYSKGGVTIRKSGGSYDIRSHGEDWRARHREVSSWNTFKGAKDIGDQFLARKLARSGAKPKYNVKSFREMSKKELAEAGKESKRFADRHMFSSEWMRTKQLRNEWNRRREKTIGKPDYYEESPF